MSLLGLAVPLPLLLSLGCPPLAVCVSGTAISCALQDLTPSPPGAMSELTPAQKKAAARRARILAKGKDRMAFVSGGKGVL
jgi:hypothetical protein